MSRTVCSFWVLLLYAVPTKSTNTMNERIGQLETFVREQSIQLVEQSRRTESMEGVIVKQQNEIRKISKQLMGVVAASHEHNKNISLLKSILHSYSNYPEQKGRQSNTTSLSPDNLDISHDIPKSFMKRKSDMPIERGHIRRAITGKTAFYAYMSQTESSPGQHHTLIFDHIATNVNNAYSNYTGTFIAPSVGTYVFTFSIGMTCHSYGSIEFVHNANVVGAFLNQHGSVCVHDTFTGTIVISVNQGDVVFLRTHASSTFSGSIGSYYNGRSSFCGWSI